MPLAKTSFPDGTIVRLTLHVSALRVPLAPGKTFHARSFDYALFSKVNLNVSDHDSLFFSIWSVDCGRFRAI